MASDERRDSSMATAIWPLLFLTAAMQVYVGLSSVAYVFMGVSNPASGPGAWAVALAGALQAVAAIAGFRPATRRDLRGTILIVAGSILLGWFSMLPSVLTQGLDFGSDDKVTPLYFVASPPIAIVSALLARRNAYPIAAALIVTAPTFVGVLVVLAFSIIIAMYGF